MVVFGAPSGFCPGAVATVLSAWFPYLYVAITIPNLVKIKFENTPHAQYLPQGKCFVSASSSVSRPPCTLLGDAPVPSTIPPKEAEIPPEWEKCMLWIGIGSSKP